MSELLLEKITTSAPSVQLDFRIQNLEANIIQNNSFNVDTLNKTPYSIMAVLFKGGVLANNLLIIELASKLSCR